MYRTSNQDYGSQYNTRSSSQKQQPQSQDQRFGFNSGQTNPPQNFNYNYYHSESYGTNIGSYGHSDYTNSKNPQFNVGVQPSKQSRPYSVSGYVMTEPTSLGLPNIGNTCYMNATLQCLFNTKQLFEYFNSGNNLIEAPNSNITEDFAELLSSVFSKTATPDHVHQAIARLKSSMSEMYSSFSGHHQHDAHEFLRFMLEKMNKELNRIPNGNQPYAEFKASPSAALTKIAEEWKKFSKLREHSIIGSIFGGSLVSEVCCESCKNKSYTFENTLDLSLDIPPPKTLQSLRSSTAYLSKCLESFTSEVQVAEYLCSKCKKKGKSKRRVMIWKQPEILVIQLKRFIHDKSGNLEVLKSNVEFPSVDLDLQPYTHKESRETRGRYRLYGIVNHYGDLDRGHYISVVYNEDEGMWIQYDDHKVKEMNKSEIEAYTKGSAEPYLLFYKRV